MAKTSSIRRAKAAMKACKTELELGYLGLESRKERVSTIAEVSAEYLQEYVLRHKSITFSEYAVRHLCEHLGTKMTAEVNAAAVNQYQSQRLREGVSGKTINDEVGFLLRLLGERGDALRTALRR